MSRHVTLYIDNNLLAKDFEKNIFGEKVPDYGLVGLHTCGDLGPTLVINYYSGSRLMLSFGYGLCDQIEQV